MALSCRTWVRLGTAPNEREACRVAVDGRESVGVEGCALGLSPVLLLPDSGGAFNVRCPGFTLTVRGGKARFGRAFSLCPELRGRGLGTYLMTRLARRAVQLGFGAVPVHALHLVRQQNTPLRNAFYRSMGFDLTLYRDGSGWARAARLDRLRLASDPAKVVEEGSIPLPQEAAVHDGALVR